MITQLTSRKFRSISPHISENPKLSDTWCGSLLRGGPMCANFRVKMFLDSLRLWSGASSDQGGAPTLENQRRSTGRAVHGEGGPRQRPTLPTTNKKQRTEYKKQQTKPRKCSPTTQEKNKKGQENNLRERKKLKGAPLSSPPDSAKHIDLPFRARTCPRYRHKIGASQNGGIQQRVFWRALAIKNTTEIQREDAQAEQKE